MSTLTKSPRLQRASALERYERHQFGAFTWSQALAAGYPQATLSNWVADGLMYKVFSTVYTRHAGSLALDTRRCAALLATQPSSSLVRLTALDVFGCSRFKRKNVCIGVKRRPRTTLDGIDIVLSDATAHGHVIERNGHRVTSFAWTVTDLGGVLKPEQLAHVIHQGRLFRHLELSELDDVIAIRGAFRGAKCVRRALIMYRAGSTGTRSHDEDTMYQWIKALVRYVPLPNMHVRAGDQSFEVDVPFVSRKLCIEVDGPLHDDPAQREIDRVRDAALRAVGYHVERFHWTDIKYRPELCKVRLRRLLASQ